MDIEGDKYDIDVREKGKRSFMNELGLKAKHRRNL